MSADERAVAIFLNSWWNVDCPNCGAMLEVDGNWFIHRRRSALHRDHWKVCVA